MEIIKEPFVHALQITAIVFVMMVVVDYLNVVSRGRIGTFIKNNGKLQYIIAAFLGSIPGCFGAFIDVSLYIRGLITFGAIAGGMIASSGDAAFVMIAMFPLTAVVLFFVLFVLGFLSAPIADYAAHKLKIKLCEKCKMSEPHSDSECLSIKHYFKEHVVRHIIGKHAWKIFLWSFAALLFVHFALEKVDLAALITNNLIWVIVLAALVGLIPDSGPHIIFVVLFARGLVPFPVLLVSSIVQDGHGILPLLSYSVKDSVFIKVFNFIIGLIIGFLCLAVSK